MVQLGSPVTANTGAAAAGHRVLKQLCQSRAQRTLHTCEVFCPYRSTGSTPCPHPVEHSAAQRTLQTSMLELSEASQPSVSPSQISW